MANVTKKEIVDEIAARTGLTQVDTKVVVECFLDSITDALVAGRRIEIRGFGRFKIRQIKPRMARNPKTGEPVMVQEGFKPVFEVSKELKKIINDHLMTGDSAKS
jgi:nucleoid DNA-binding protein